MPKKKHKGKGQVDESNFEWALYAQAETETTLPTLGAGTVLHIAQGLLVSLCIRSNCGLIAIPVHMISICKGGLLENGQRAKDVAKRYRNIGDRIEHDRFGKIPHKDTPQKFLPVYRLSGPSKLEMR
jgi:hypothetical protein